MYDDAGADELVFYDITASSDGRNIMIDVDEKPRVMDFGLARREGDGEPACGVSPAMCVRASCAGRAASADQAGALRALVARSLSLLRC